MLITGATGRLGKELLKVFPEALHPTRREFDVANYVQVRGFISTKKPKIIIHAAALTDVNYCETHMKEAYETNVTGTANIVDCVADSCLLVYVSTACVFNGDRGNYVESDLPYPKNYYGLTKLLAEQTVATLDFPLIIRTNFIANEKWRYERAFTDRFGTYLFAGDVAHAIKQLIESGYIGVVHVCGERRMSMFELAKATTPGVEPMTMQDYTGPAQLTRDMSLSSVRIKPFKIGSIMVKQDKVGDR